MPCWLPILPVLSTPKLQPSGTSPDRLETRLAGDAEGRVREREAFFVRSGLAPDARSFGVLEVSCVGGRL